MIHRKKMKVGNITFVYHNEVFDVIKDRRKIKKKIKFLIKEINRLDQQYRFNKNHLLAKYDSIFEKDIFKLFVPKENVKARVIELQHQRNSLIDDLRSFACFVCPVTQEMQKLDIDARIQDLYSHIASKQADLLKALSEKDGEAKMQSMDPSYGDKYVNGKVYNHSTGVRVCNSCFDKGLDIFTESDDPINGTEDDVRTNQDFVQLETLEVDDKQESVYNFEEQLKASYI